MEAWLPKEVLHQNPGMRRKNIAGTNSFCLFNTLFHPTPATLSSNVFVVCLKGFSDDTEKRQSLIFKDWLLPDGYSQLDPGHSPVRYKHFTEHQHYTRPLCGQDGANKNKPKSHTPTCMDSTPLPWAINPPHTLQVRVGGLWADNSVMTRGKVCAEAEKHEGQAA